MAARGPNRLLLHRFVERVTGPPVILMGNSMGGMISLLEAAAHPEAVAGLVLLDAAAPFVPALPDPAVAALFTAYALPWAGRIARARRSAMPAETLVGLMLRLCCVDPARVPPEVVAEHVRMARHRGERDAAGEDLVRAARSVLRTAAGPAYRAAVGAVRAPALLVHGQRDRLVPVAASGALARRHPTWPLEVLLGVGHLPQLEAPHETAEAVLRWLRATRHATSAAAHPLADHA
ncbi:alpha/beta hydrolase [Nonomuraea gerenzanensis]|nr:alpha/beta hydrolase [Nonomuraea gerenzanensis]